MDVHIRGVGMSDFGKQPTRSTQELVWTAVAEALADAAYPDLDAIFVGTCFGEPGIAQRALHRMGLVGVPISIFENACASSTQAFHEACAAVDAERFGTVLVLGVEHLTSRFSGAIPVELRDHEGGSGLALPALYAMSASRYQCCYGVSDEQFAAVSVKNHAHGSHNPRAQHRKAVTLEQVLSSRLIADPLTQLQCCAIADGAAACVVGKGKQDARDIHVLASAFGTGGLWDHKSERVWGFDLVAATAREAYESAGRGVADVDVLEVHDAFTVGELVTIEALGVAPIGAGGALTVEGVTTLGGRQPVNPSGGLLSRGHPLGATGIAQIAEIVWQLRDDAGARQVEGARTGLVETMGGGAGGIDGNACVVVLLGR
jgi:acetyl-CoA acetyltransferase